ncbi:tryptophan halogenase family protein [Pleionea sediminis]|uniref:tryptophan halogenase family protein n=1 Tax=Pleionea sediminis TaxID=2569479 RepID=UPI0011852B1C|nr:tryptophan halogenase family protein [Pleionea sediminis]
MKPYKSVVILGGGTAGWMAANYLIKKWKDKGISVTLVESPDIGIVGVGEGSTPSMQNFFHDMDIPESKWMPECHATYKAGITFAGWSTKPGFEKYCHPFPCEVDAFSSSRFAHSCRLRRFGHDVDVHPDKFFLQSYLSNHQLSPIANHSFPFLNFYGYHFDSGLLGEFLCKVAVERGVKHLQRKVEQAHLDEQGNIRSLSFAEGDSISGDLYIDCSGFSSVLLQKTLGVDFVPFSENLFNDSAVVMPTPRGDSLNSQTISTAMKHGWAWDIPLTSRTGNGYVYSSSFCSADDAETELRQKLDLLDSDVEVRHLKMKVGRTAHHWFKNCLGVGLSQGFIEPLEATALHLVQVTIQEFMLNCEEGNFTDQNRDKFNQLMNRRFEGVRDYIVAHYRLNSRTDTEYWRANASNQKLSESLIRILNSWTGGLKHDLDEEIEQQGIGHFFPIDSWRILLAGYGFLPPIKSDLAPLGKFQKVDIDHQIDFIQRCALNYRSQMEAVEH